MMDLEIYSSVLLKEQLKAIFRKYLNDRDYKLFFFGSRITGESGKTSDIDVGIEADFPIESETWLDIQDEVFELPIILKIDLTDFKRVSESFKRIALQKTELIDENRKAA